MTFQLWEIPNGQVGEGMNVHGALLSAIGKASACNNIDVKYLSVGIYNLGIPSLEQKIGLMVLTSDIAICYEVPLQPVYESFDSSQLAPPEAWPRAIILPSLQSYVSIHTLSENEARGTLEATVWKVVRHVESTSAWDSWLVEQQPPA